MGVGRSNWPLKECWVGIQLGNFIQRPHSISSWGRPIWLLRGQTWWISSDRPQPQVIFSFFCLCFFRGAPNWPSSGSDEHGSPAGRFWPTRTHTRQYPHPQLRVRVPVETGAGSRPHPWVCKYVAGFYGFILRVTKYFVRINCSVTFYVNFKPSTIKIGWELNKLCYILWNSKIWLPTFAVFTIFFIS